MPRLLADVPIFLLIPLLLGLLYASAAIAFKRAMAEGADPWRVAFWSNQVSTLALLPLLVFAHRPEESAAIYQPIIVGVFAAAGWLLATLAIQKGDVSIATPVMGTKVLFVATFTVILLGNPVQTPLWVAAFLVFLSLLLLRGPGRGTHQRFAATLLLASAAAASFALCDVLIQAWSRHWGFGLFVPAIFAVVAILSLGLIWRFPRRTAPLGGKAVGWLAAGCVLNSLQNGGMVLCLSLYRDPNAATAINVVYNSRGIWSIAMIWVVGHWFGNYERAHGWRVMAARLAGALLLLAAIAMTLSRG